MESEIQDGAIPTQSIQQQPSKPTSTSASSKPKLKIIIAISVIVIFLIGIGGYVIAKNSQSISQNTLGKDSNCGTDLDCFIKAAQNCSTATVSKTYPISQENLNQKMTYEIKGQASEKCILATITELEVDIDSSKAKESEITEETKEEIKQINEKQRQAGITCELDKNELVLAIQDLKVGKNTLNEKISACNSSHIYSQADNTGRESDVMAILNTVKQYMADNDGEIPSVIAISEQEISRTQADLCSILVPTYIMALPVDPKVNDGEAITDCSSSYSTGYTIFKDASNKITVKAPNAELGKKIEVTR